MSPVFRHDGAERLRVPEHYPVHRDDMRGNRVVVDEEICRAAGRRQRPAQPGAAPRAIEAGMGVRTPAVEYEARAPAELEDLLHMPVLVRKLRKDLEERRPVVMVADGEADRDRAAPRGGPSAVRSRRGRPGPTGRR